MITDLGLRAVLGQMAVLVAVSALDILACVVSVCQLRKNRPGVFAFVVDPSLRKTQHTSATSKSTQRLEKTADSPHTSLSFSETNQSFGFSGSVGTFQTCLESLQIQLPANDTLQRMHS